MNGQLTYMAAREHGADLRRAAQKASAISAAARSNTGFDRSGTMRRTRRLAELRRRLRVA
jgi:hypothetical protein